MASAANFVIVSKCNCNTIHLLPQVLQNNAKYQVVPKKLTIGKRLAQCLHPALPSGVHRKALETYEIIFKIIGPKRLAKDLFLYR